MGLIDKITLFLFVICALIIVGCNRDKVDSNLESRLYDLENSISDLRYELESLTDEKELSDLGDRVLELELKAVENSSATFNLTDGSSKFQTIDTGLGILFISVADVTPHLSGFKVTFKLGNPQQATYENLKFNVNWRRSYASYKNDSSFIEKFEKYQKELEEYKSRPLQAKQNIQLPKKPYRPSWFDETSSKEYSISKSILPGQWNLVEIYITPASLQTIEYVTVEIVANTISLTAAR